MNNDNLSAIECAMLEQIKELVGRITPVASWDDGVVLNRDDWERLKDAQTVLDTDLSQDDLFSDLDE